MANEMQQILTQTKVTVHKFKLPELEDLGLTTCTDLQKSLTLCPVSMSPFIKPTTLSCGYTLCFDCIPKSTSFQCPSFTCLRTHSDINKPTVLVEEIQSLLLTDKNIQPIKSLLDCPICFATLSEPTTTKCGHTFCKSCLNKVVDDFHCKRCPICRSELNSVSKCNQLLHRWVSLFSASQNSSGKALNEYMPVIEVDGIVIFPSQSCLVHVAKDYSLFAEMVKEPNQIHYAICLSKNKDGQYDCIGTMMQISNIEYIPDLRKCVVLMKGLYHVQINNLKVEDNEFTGDIIPLNDPFCVSLSKPKRWTLPIPNNNESGDQHELKNCTSNPTVTIPCKRRRPCSMRSSISSPNQSTYRQDSVKPGAYTRPTWNDVMSKHFYGHSSTPLLSVVSDIKQQRMIQN